MIQNSFLRAHAGNVEKRGHVVYFDDTQGTVSRFPQNKPTGKEVEKTQRHGEKNLAITQTRKEATEVSTEVSGTFTIFFRNCRWCFPR